MIQKAKHKCKIKMKWSSELGGWEYYISCRACDKADYNTISFDYAIYYANRHFTKFFAK